MADLLLHSMAEFEDVILPALESAGARDVVEIGAEDGTMTRRLIAHAAAAGGTFAAVDPAPAPGVARLLAGHAHARLVRARSLDAIPELSADAWLVDGDHNYYTVRHESERILERCRATARPLLVFYHDVAWPWARRDLYYDPASLPPAAVHPHTWDHGVVPGVEGVVEGGFRGEGHWACALEEGGPRNGVLTAIEDFVAGREAQFRWAYVPAVFGLGVLFDTDAPWADDLAAFLQPFHLHPLLQRMEANRLACYLRVLEMQDRAHGLHA